MANKDFAPGTLDTHRNRHNYKRLGDLRVLREEYKRRGWFNRYAMNFAFWYYAYAILWYRNKESARYATMDFIKLSPDTLEKYVFKPVEDKYHSLSPYLLTNKGFVKKFNIPVSVRERLLTVSEPISVNDRVKAYRKRKGGEKKAISVFTRRVKAATMKKNGYTIEKIAKALKTSVSTVFSDLKRDRETKEQSEKYRFLRRCLIKKKNYKTTKTPTVVEENIEKTEEMDVLDFIRMGVEPVWYVYT